MKDGFIRVAAATPDLKVADPVFNREQTWKMMQEAADQDVKILVFPELGLTGYTCGLQTAENAHCIQSSNSSGQNHHRIDCFFVKTTNLLFSSGHLCGR